MVDLERKIIANKNKSDVVKCDGCEECNLINMEDPIEYAYKYMTLEVFYSCIKNGNLRMQEPSNWKDEYEGRFYKAKYHNITNNPLPKLYATCITMNPAQSLRWIS